VLTPKVIEKCTDNTARISV